MGSPKYDYFMLLLNMSWFWGGGHTTVVSQDRMGSKVQERSGGKPSSSPAFLQGFLFLEDTLYVGKFPRNQGENNL